MRGLIFAILITSTVCLKVDLFDGNDPKESYFRYIKTYMGETINPGYENNEYRGNVPKPGGFELLDRDYQRRRRHINSKNVDDQSNPFELDVLDADANSTEAETAGDDGKNDLKINDFIRFKRQVEEVTEQGSAVPADQKNIDVEADNVRAKREHERNGKMLLSADETLPEGSREPRGAAKDQWIKHPYPVQTSDPHRHFDDNLQAASEAARAPRVHFVTQRRSESAPPLLYHSYEREGRSRELNRQRDMDLDRDFEPAYPYPRPPRHYSPEPPLENFPYRPLPDPYYREDSRIAYDRERYMFRRPEYDYPGQDRDRYYGDENRPAPAVTTKQKRIIYYATLPEIVRHPSSGDFRDRYNYRGTSDRYNSDSRYLTSAPLSVGHGINYRIRNENPYGSKSRYEEATKSAYPSKVSSSDVNVREIKKNPERRIYSEADQRYAYKTSDYRHGE